MAASILAAAAAWPASEAAAGSGFELRSQSASTLGSAQAGITCGVADVSTIVFNPASLAYATGIEGAIGVTGLSTGVKFNPSTATTVLGTPIPGSSGGDAGTSVAIPNLYLGAQLAAQWRVGVAIAPRFGLGSYWADDWVGRYYARDSELRTIDVVPMTSWRFDERWSFGFGIDAQYAKIKTSTAIDFGTIDVAVTGGAFGGLPGRSDGGTSADADSWGVGFAFGAIFEPRPGTRFGLDYHGKIRQSFSGPAAFTLGGSAAAGVAAVSGGFSDTRLTADLDMPAVLTAGLYRQIGANWALMADLKWTDWSAFSTLTVNFDNPAQPASSTDYRWRDAWSAAIGARYRISAQTALRFGVAYEQSPTRDGTRNPVIPDTDSRWVAVGVEHRFSGKLKLDVAYGHIFATDAPIELSAISPDNTFRGNLSGTIKDSHVDYLALQLAHSFR